MTLTTEERELLKEATLKLEEFKKLPEMKIHVVYTSYYPAWVISVLKELKKNFPKKKFRLRFQIVEIKNEERKE